MDFHIAYRNLETAGGTFSTPVWFGLHDEAFDLFEIGEAASEGLERIAEDGTFDAIAGEFGAADDGGRGGVLFGPGTPPVVGPLETAGTVAEDVNPDEEFLVSFAAMVLPSNDAFFGSSDPIVIFDDEGNFLGAQDLLLTGANIYDAGTEVNTEEDAAFINQTGPDTGIDENGVITLHPGFNGSVGNPGGTQNILGGTNALGFAIDPEAADFSADRSDPVGVFHVNVITETVGDDTAERVIGDETDDFVTAGGGNDTIRGRDGWDVIDGGDGDDVISGNSGADILNGGAGEDRIFGDGQSDEIFGGDGDDILNGGDGDDRINGGDGRDVLEGGLGADIFDFGVGAGADVIRDFEVGVDAIDVSAFDVAFEDVAVSDRASGNADVSINGELVAILVDVNAADLTAGDFLV